MLPDNFTLVARPTGTGYYTITFTCPAYSLPIATAEKRFNNGFILFLGRNSENFKTMKDAVARVESRIDQCYQQGNLTMTNVLKIWHEMRSEHFGEELPVEFRPRPVLPFAPLRSASIKSDDIPDVYKFATLMLKDEYEKPGTGFEIDLGRVAKSMNVKHLAHLCLDFFNSFDGHSPETFAAIITRQHPTLQQIMIRWMFNVLCFIPVYTWHTDPRNEAGVQLAREIAKLDRSLPQI